LAITLRVEWSNKDDELLTQDARPHVHVSAGGVEVPSKPGTSSRPFPEYEIPDTAQSVRVELAVIGTINLKYAEQSRPWRRFRDDISKSRIARQRDLPLLLWAAQEFRVMRSGNVPLEPVEPLHPLMVCLAAGSAVGTVAIVRVWTDFLDVTDYFFLNLRHGQIRNCRMNGKSPRGEIGRKCMPIFIMPRMRARIARIRQTPCT